MQSHRATALVSPLRDSFFGGEPVPALTRWANESAAWRLLNTLNGVITFGGITFGGIDPPSALAIGRSRSLEASSPRSRFSRLERRSEPPSPPYFIAPTSHRGIVTAKRDSQEA